MRKYIEHIRNNRTPHERRQHAMQIAGVITAILFVGWITTLGVRISSTQGTIVSDAQNNTASTLTAVQEEEGSTNWLGY